MASELLVGQQNLGEEEPERYWKHAYHRYISRQAQLRSMPNAGIQRSFSSSYITYKCKCGWLGNDSDIEDWNIQLENDRAVRVCPSCEESVPEWGTHRPLNGISKVARGALQKELERVL